MFFILVPWLVVLLFGLGILLFVFKKWKFGTAILVIGIFLNANTEALPLNLLAGNKEGDLKVMSYNISAFSEQFQKDTTFVDSMAKFILEEHSEVLVLLEYDTIKGKRLDSLLHKQYAYSEVQDMGSTNVVYSKYPLSDKMELLLDSASVMNESLELAAEMDSTRTKEHERLVLGLTVHKGKKRLRLIACHLASNQYDRTRKTMGADKEWREGIPQYLLSFQSGGMARETEAQYIQQEVEKYKKQGMPVIVCGDMNDVSGSKALRMLQSTGLKNAWWEKGRGFGFTYHGHHFMNFRIDHILHTEDIKVKSIKKIDQHFSDHDPVIASFAWM